MYHELLNNLAALHAASPAFFVLMIAMAITPPLVFGTSGIVSIRRKHGTFLGYVFLTLSIAFIIITPFLLNFSFDYAEAAADKEKTDASACRAEGGKWASKNSLPPFFKPFCLK